MRFIFRNLLAIAVCSATISHAQKLGSGIGIYPSGTETGLGWRSGKDTRWVLDARIAKANVITKPETGSFINELSLSRRVVYYEKARFHIGLGVRADWNYGNQMSHRYGIVVPIGVEAFPFPFQTAGLFFEAAPFCTFAENNRSNIGIRTVGGFIFYFLRK
jgi:hypothetical protein